MLRVGEQVRHALSDVLQRGEVRDDVIEVDRDLDLGGPHVAGSQDRHRLRVAARAPDNDAVIKALARNAKFIRGRVSGALRQMRSMPEFRFRLDTSYDNMAKIDRAAALARSGAGSGRREDEK